MSGRYAWRRINGGMIADENAFLPRNAACRMPKSEAEAGVAGIVPDLPEEAGYGYIRHLMLCGWTGQ